MTFRILTLGCKVNQYESEALSEQLVEAGFAPAPENRPADLYVVNTCTVTGESDRKSRQFIRRAASENPGAPVLVTGCLSQRQSEEVSRIPGVRFVCGTREKAKVVDFARSLADGSRKAESRRLCRPPTSAGGSEGCVPRRRGAAASLYHLRDRSRIRAWRRRSCFS